MAEKIYETNTAIYVMQKIDCPTEEKLIRNKLESMEGVDELRFNLMQRELTVAHHLNSDETIFTALQELDMEPKRQGVGKMRRKRLLRA